MKHAGGRPTKYSKELGDAICLRIAGKESVRSICKDDKMPSATTVFNWLLDDDKKEFLEHYVRAKDIQTDQMFEELMEIAYESDNVILGNDKSDSARVQAKKLQVDTLKWVLSKQKPKKYGDKLDLTSDGKQLPAPILGGIANKDGTIHKNNSGK